MATIHSLEIKNFRGIKTLSHVFGGANLICFVGRGDSGKTSILEAISYALYPSWNLTVTDNDFYNCDANNPIEIEVTLNNVEGKLLVDTKYGLYIRKLDEDGKTVIDEVGSGSDKLITVSLKIESDLEPKWVIASKRPHQEDVEFKTADRSTLGVYLLSDYLDRHFSWGKGAPLYSLLKEDESISRSQVLLNEMRNLKSKIDATEMEHFANVTERVKLSSKKFGASIENTKSSIDIKDLVTKDSKMVLHDDVVPLRLKGKGSKRIASIAIQFELAQNGILLVDEIEQGLEPDRVKHLIRSLGCDANEQVFITTHSQGVVEELEPENLFIVNNNDGVVEINQGSEVERNKFKRLYRTCPEALYANRVIVCEGKTEIGICRAMDRHRAASDQPSMSGRGIVYTNGNGSDFTNKSKLLKEDLGKDVCVLCDSDRDADLNPTKIELESVGVKLIDCEGGMNIEKQVSVDLPWQGIMELVDYVASQNKGIVDFVQHVRQTAGIQLGDSDTQQNRESFASASTTGEWFKRIDHGEFLGDTILKHYGSLASTSRLKTIIDELNSWIDV